MSSQYGIVIKTEVTQTSIKQAYDNFKKLESAVKATRSELDRLKKQNDELKAKQNILTASFYGLSKGANVAVTVLKALGAVLFDNQKKIKDNTKAQKAAKAADKAASESKKQLFRDALTQAKAFSESTNTVMQNSRAIKENIERLQELRDFAKQSGQKNIFTDAITKSDFTRNIKDLNSYTAALKRTTTALSLMSMEGGGPNFGGGTTSNQSIQGLLQFDQKNALNSENAIKNYIQVLENLVGSLNTTEKEYGQVIKKIQEMNRLLKEGRKVGVPSPTGYSAEEYGPRPAMAGERTFARMTAGNKQFKKGGMFYEPGGFAARRKGALSSALIGGGFPLLFGQGIGASIGGGVGGGIGGMLGGGLGFGLSLVGTQLGKQFDLIYQGAQKAGKALGEFSKDTTALIESIGAQGSIISTRIDLIKQLKGEQAAFNAATKEMTMVVGEDGVAALKEFGEDTQQMQQGWQQMMFAISTGLAKLINQSQVFADLAGIFGGWGRGTRVKGSNNEGAKEMMARIKELKKGILWADAADYNRRREEILLLEKKIDFLLKEDRIFEARELRFQLATAEISKQLELNEAIGYELNKQKQIELQMAEIKKTYKGSDEDWDLAKDRIRAMIEDQYELTLGAGLLRSEITKLDTELVKLMDTGYQITEAAKAFGGAFSESFKGIVKGTMTAQQALANLFQRTADAFLDMAAKMIAEQIKLKILGIAFNMFGFGSKSKVGSGVTDQEYSDAGGYLYDINKKRAAGGPVTGGDSYLVGEKGPELFVPNSSGNIVSNDAMGGSMVVNVDASGSSAEGDDDRSRQLGELIGAAVQSEIIRQQRPGGTLY